MNTILIFLILLVLLIHENALMNSLRKRYCEQEAKVFNFFSSIQLSLLRIPFFLQSTNYPIQLLPVNCHDYCFLDNEVVIPTDTRVKITPQQQNLPS